MLRRAGFKSSHTNSLPVTSLSWICNTSSMARGGSPSARRMQVGVWWGDEGCESTKRCRTWQASTENLRMAFHEFSSIKVGTCEEGNEPGSAHALEVLLALGNARDKIVGIDECLHKFNFHSQYILGQARCLLFQRGKRLVLTMAPPDQPWTNRPSLSTLPPSSPMASR